MKKSEERSRWVMRQIQADEDREGGEDEDMKQSY